MIAVHTIGQAAIDTDQSRITPTSVRKFALLLYLASEAGREVPRFVLQDMIFPDQSEKNARHSLRELVYQLRQVGARFTSNSSAVGLVADAVRVDYVDILARQSLEPRHLLVAEQGFLPGYAPTHSEAFSEWLDALRARVGVQLCRVLLRHAAASRATGDWDSTEQAARACLALDPVNDEATLFLAEMLAIGGAKAQAVRLLDRYVEEIGRGSKEMRLPASVLKHRITDRFPQDHRKKFVTPFVGRTTEMLELNQRLELVRRDKCQCVVLLGDPGIGKSRLLSEFCTVAVLEGAIVASTSLQPTDLHRPFGTFVDLLPSLVAMPGALGCSPEALCSLQHLSNGRAPSNSVLDGTAENEARCHSWTQAVIDLVEAVCSEQVLVLGIEDVHWMDAMSSRVLSLLADPRRQRRVLVLLTTRQRTGVPLLHSDAENISTINVHRLNSEASKQLITALVQTCDVQVDQEMSNWIEETSQGNPLFLESLFSHYANTKERFAISPTLTALLDRRLQTLSSEATTVLRICALLGKHSTLATISAATQLPQFALLRAVSELESLGLIKADGAWVHPAHALIAEGVQRAAGIIEIRFAHRCVAIALETLLETHHSAAVIWDCAEHWIIANNPERALTAIGNCVRYATGIGRPRDAAGILARALQLEVLRDDRVGLARQLVIAADAAGEPDLVLEGLRVLRNYRQAEKHDDIEFAEFRARARTFQYSPVEQERLLQCAKALAAPPSHRVTAALWLLKYAEIHATTDAVAEAISVITDSVLEAAPATDRFEFGLVRACILRQWDQAGEAARELLLATSSGPISGRITTRLNAAVGLWRSGFLPSAIEAATLAYIDALVSGCHRLGVTVASFLADVNFQLGDDDEARAWISRALITVSEMPELQNHFSLTMIRIAGAIFSGDTSAARTLFDRSNAAGVFDGGGLRERWKIAAELRLRQVETGTPMPASEIDRVSSEVDRPHPMSGILDFEVVSACEALVMAHRYAEADTLRRRFIESEYRSRTVLPRGLRDVSRTSTSRLPLIRVKTSGSDTDLVIAHGSTESPA